MPDAPNPDPSSTPAPAAVLMPSEKVREFPTAPGVYLMKDAQGRVVYVGKAKNLRSRASSYFHKASAEDRRICDWIGEVVDIDFLAADSEGRRPAGWKVTRLDQGHPAQTQHRAQG